MENANDWALNCHVCREHSHSTKRCLTTSVVQNDIVIKIMCGLNAIFSACLWQCVVCHNVSGGMQGHNQTRFFIALIPEGCTSFSLWSGLEVDAQSKVTFANSWLAMIWE